MSYKYGLPQPSKRLKISCLLLAEEKIAYINQVFNTIFEINQPLEHIQLHPRINASISSASNEQKTALKQLSMHCALAHQLQEQVGLPSFARALLLDYQVSSDTPPPTITATLFIPWYLGDPDQTIANTHQLAQHALQTLAQYQPATKETFDTLSQEHIKQLQQTVPSGKSTVPILRAAHAHQIPFFHLGQGVYQLGTGALGQLVDKSAIQSDSMIGAKISQDKLLTKNLLKQLGYPTPEGERIQTIKDAELFFAKYPNKPMVIKPQNADRGEGITLNIQSIDEIPSAFSKAQEFSKAILIEEMVSGICHRIAVIDQKILFVVKRNPKYITGDGHHSISELMAIENDKEVHKAPYLRKIELSLDQETQDYLAFQKFSPDHIPAKDQRIHVRPTESTNWGGIAEDLTDQIHPANAQLALKVAKALRLTICGLDFMTEDISVPWHINHAHILEANFSPFMATNSESGRKKLEQLIHTIFKQGSRIPIDVFIGDHAAWHAAQQTHAKHLSQNVSSFLISRNTVIGPDQIDIQQKHSLSLYDRWYGLLLDPNVGGLVIHVDNDELLETGLPIDQIDQYAIINHQIDSKITDPLQRQHRYQMLIELFNQHSNSSKK